MRLKRDRRGGQGMVARNLRHTATGMIYQCRLALPLSRKFP